MTTKPHGTQSVNRTTFADHPQLNVHIQNKTPSWLNYGCGHASASFTLNRDSLSIDAMEAGSRSSRRVMITLDEPAMRALFELLREKLVADAPPNLTPTPWNIDGGYGTMVERDAEGERVHIADCVDREHALHIVRCVNACAKAKS